MQPFTLLLAGDVMTGRGIDQALPRPGDPTLHEPLVRDARRYVALAEAAHGAFARPLDPADGRLLGLRMVPTRMERFRLRRAGMDDAAWLAGTLSGTSARFGCAVDAADDGTLALRW